MVESLSAPPMPLTWSVSMRSRTSPSIAKPDRCTLRAAAVRGVLAVEADAGVHRAVRAPASARATSWPLMIVYQLPAPSIVTSSTMMCRFTWYVPGGM